MKTYLISPMDTWFFRDGRPYNMNESSQVDVKSVFPPSAHTVVGAMRASLARAMGWKGKSHERWSSSIESILGNERADLGKLRFQGPYIYSDNHGLLLPAPFHLLGKAPQGDEKAWSFVRLAPGDPVDCDLGDDVRLPSVGDKKGFKALNGYYLTTRDFEALLAGSDLSKLNPVPYKEIWDLEYWVGLRRNSFTLTTEDRALFSKYHVRLAPHVSLLMRLDGPDGLPEPGPILALGGENRTACTRIMKDGLNFPAAPELKVEGGKLRFTLTHLTPANLGGSWPGHNDRIPVVPGKPSEVVPGEVVSACLERPMFLGGWNSIRREPLPLQPYIPAGSTWFCEADAGEMSAVKSLHLAHIGDEVGFGFGQVAVGSW